MNYMFIIYTHVIHVCYIEIYIVLLSNIRQLDKFMQATKGDWVEALLILYYIYCGINNV